MNENGLSRLQFGHVHQSLPCSQGAHRYRRSFHEVERLGFRGHFPFFYRDVIRPATSESWVTVNCVASFEFRDIRARLLDDTCDVVARDERQMRPEFARVFAAEREWVGWIDTARDHPHESFVFV